MAKINNTSAYAQSSPVTGDDIVIGSVGGAGGDTKNFLMSDIFAYVMSSSTLTLQDVCDNGATTSTGITVAGTATLNGALDANSTADISGAVTLGSTLEVDGLGTFNLGVNIDSGGLAMNDPSAGIIVVGSSGIVAAGGGVSGTSLSTSGGLLVLGTSILGEIESAGPADIADTLTLSKATGTGLSVVSNTVMGGSLSVDDIRSNIGNNLTISSGTNLAASLNTFARFVFEYGITATSGTSVFDGIRLTNTAPSSASDTGTTGDIAVDADYIYVCTATDTWKRVAIATW